MTGGWREVFGIIRWFWSGRSLPEESYSYAIELEEARADLVALLRVLSVGGAVIAAAVVTGYVLGAMR